MSLNNTAETMFNTTNFFIERGESKLKFIAFLQILTKKDVIL